MSSKKNKASSASQNVERIPLSATERAYFKLSQERSGASRVGLVARLVGVPFSTNALADALHRVKQRHPILRAVVSRDKKRGLEFLIDGDAKRDADESKPCEIRVFERKHSNSWLDAWNEECLGTYKLNSPLLCVVLVVVGGQASTSSGSENFDLILALDHFACDGISMSALMNEMLCLLTDQEPPSRTALSKAPSADELFALENNAVCSKWGCIRSMLQCMMNCCHRKPLKEKYCGKFDSYRPIIEVPLSESTTQDMVKATRRAGTTITGFLAAIVMACVAAAEDSMEMRNGRKRHTKLRSVKCLLAADLRTRYRKNPGKKRQKYSMITTPLAHEHLGVHVGLILAQGNVVLSERACASSCSAENLWALARTVCEQARNQLLSGNTFNSARLIPIALDFSARGKTKPNESYVGFLSNFGVVKELSRQYGKWYCERAIPILGSIPKNQRPMMAMTMAGKMTLSLHVPDVVLNSATSSDVLANNAHNNQSISQAKARYSGDTAAVEATELYRKQVLACLYTMLGNVPANDSADKQENTV